MVEQLISLLHKTDRCSVLLTNGNILCNFICCLTNRSGIFYCHQLQALTNRHFPGLTSVLTSASQFSDRRTVETVDKVLYIFSTYSYRNI